MTTHAQTGAAFAPSAYQSNILAAVESGSGDIIVNAVAGSGKSTTLKMAAQRIRTPGIFLAFNVHIAKSLGEKLAGTQFVARTIHSVGFGCVSRASKTKPDVKANKYAKLTRALVDRYPQEFPFAERSRHASRLRKLVDFSRLTLTPTTDSDAFSAMCDRYNLEREDGDLPRVAQLIADGDALARESGVIDYTDMLWLPYAWRLQPDRYGWTLVDECQDLNAAQLHLVLKMRDRGGRMMFVGDPAQAIMAFAGADAASYWTIQEATAAAEMPLSVCYRCPRSHVELAREDVPHIEWADRAPEGEVVHADDAIIGTEARDGDLILSRMNAPLIKHCLRLIRQKKTARIRGRDVGKELADLIREIAARAPEFGAFPDYVNKWADEQRERLTKQDANESAFDIVEDKREALVNCYDGFPATNAEDLACQIEALFSDERCGIWLSSIHRAKGLEADRVFILEHARLGQPRNRSTAEEAQQERNLRYVARTRAKQTLFLL